MSADRKRLLILNPEKEGFDPLTSSPIASGATWIVFPDIVTGGGAEGDDPAIVTTPPLLSGSEPVPDSPWFSYDARSSLRICSVA